MIIDILVIGLLILYFGFLVYRLFFNKKSVGGCSCAKIKRMKKNFDLMKKDLRDSKN